MRATAVAALLFLGATAAAEAAPKSRAGRSARTGGTPRAPEAAAAAGRTPANLPGEIKLPILVRLGDVLLASGQVGRAIDFYDRFRFNFDSEPLFWRRFAALYEQAGDLERSLACLEHVSRLEINVFEDGMKEAELLWRLARPGAALARLVGLKPQAEEGDTRFWQLLFDLAWVEEREALAIESLQVLWRSKRTPALARDLCHMMAKLGEYEKGARIALEAIEQRPDATVLLLGMRLAVEGRREALADALMEQADLQIEAYRERPEFFLARALFASFQDQSGEANRDFAQAAALRPRLQEACPAWLEASVALEDRVMAEAALARCGPEESRQPASWDLLADVYAMLGGVRQAAHWRALAREQSGWADPAAMADCPAGLSPLEHQLLDAIERDDRPGVTTTMLKAPGPFRLPYQVAALQALDCPDEAWVLLEGAGFAARDITPVTREEAVLVKKALRMRSDWLSGGWARTEAVALGSLRYYGVRAWAEQRFRPVYVGVEAGHTFLQFAPDAEFSFRSHELEVGAWLRRRRTNTDTKLRGGVRFLGRGELGPYARLTHQYRPGQSPLHLELRAWVGDLPVYTGLLRAMGVRDGGEILGGWMFPHQLEASASIGVSRFSLRDRRLLSTELALYGELARRFEMEYWSLRPRLFVSHNGRRNQPGVSGVVQVDGSDEAALRQVQLGDYSSAGAGVSVGNDFGTEPQGRAPRRSYRYSLSAWAAYVLPSLQQGYGIEAHFGFVFARRQELAASAFLYGGWREAVAEQYGGLSLSYVARWF